MSGESLLHVRLVERLIKHIRNRHECPRGLLVLADHHEFGDNRPGTIEGFTPDVFASDLPATFEVLGEAKTPDDLMTDRSRRQLSAFLNYLAVRPNSTFYLAVPPFTKSRSEAILKTLLTPKHASISIEVIDGV
jgi:hypothetical protein